jgi:putative membrane protein
MQVVTKDVAGGVSHPDSTSLALDRTWLAHERTLMAWVRTAVSLISFGFSIYKFFDSMREKGEGEAAGRLIGPREFALIMISIGLFSLVLATAQHLKFRKKAREISLEVPFSLATLTGGLIGLLGILALLAVIFRQ